MDDWEYLFGPNFSSNVCDHCGQSHIADATIVQVVHLGTTTTQFHYCSTACQQEHYLKHLRNGL